MEFNGYQNGLEAEGPEDGRCVWPVYVSRGYDDDSWVTLCGFPTEDDGESEYCEAHG